MGTGDWRTRLRYNLEKNDKSWREVSLAAGLSAGYISSILHEGKEPTFKNLLAIIDEIGVSLSSIVFGVEMGPDEEELLRAFSKLDADAKETFLRMAKLAARDKE